MSRHVENNAHAQDLVAALILKLAYSAGRVEGVEKGGSHSASSAIDTSQSFAMIAPSEKATGAISRLSCAAPSALVRIAEALASHFRNRIGGRSAFVASEIILSARDPSNPCPCLFWSREAKVS